MTLQPNELRIGSRIRIKGQSSFYTVSMIEESGSLYLKECPYLHYALTDDTIEGILLSKDVLSRCGFEFRGNYLAEPWYTLKDISISQWGQSYRLCEEDSYVGNIYAIGKAFFYLHQLQNLYFALTGEDIQIKL